MIAARLRAPAWLDQRPHLETHSAFEETKGYGGESRVSRIIHEGKFRDARLAIAISARPLWAIASVLADERVRISNYLEKYPE